MLPLLLAVLASLATLLGWALVAVRRRWPDRAIGWFLLGAGAAMCLISGLELLPTAVGTGLTPISAALWTLLGAAAVLLGRQLAVLAGLGSDRLNRSAGLIAVTIGVHNIPEGAATVGTALISVPAGVVTAIAVAIHNIPEGIAVAAPVAAAGGSRRRSFAYTVVATGGEVLGAVLAAIFGQIVAPEQFAPMLAIVAGVMIALSVRELFPSGLQLVRATQPTVSAPGARSDDLPVT